MLSVDIQNTYLTALLTAKYYTIVKAENGFTNDLDGIPYIIMYG